MVFARREAEAHDGGSLVRWRGGVGCGEGEEEEKVEGAGGGLENHECDSPCWSIWDLSLLAAGCSLLDRGLQSDMAPAVGGIDWALLRSLRTLWSCLRGFMHKRPSCAGCFRRSARRSPRAGRKIMAGSPAPPESRSSFKLPRYTPLIWLFVRILPPLLGRSFSLGQRYGHVRRLESAASVLQGHCPRSCFKGW